MRRRIYIIFFFCNFLVLTIYDRIVCSLWQIFWKIVMPYIKSATATLVVFSFTSAWNDYLGPVIYITNNALKTLPLAVQTVSGGAGALSLATAGAMAAATFITVLPTIIVYTAMQGRVMNTMAHSGIKE